LLDVSEHAPVSVHPRHIVCWTPARAQHPDDAPEQERFQTAHVVRVLMTHEDVTNLGWLGSTGDQRANDIEPAPRVEQDAAAFRPFAPLDEQCALMASLVRGPSGAEQPNTHP
jgi:hypothetical protein